MSKRWIWKQRDLYILVGKRGIASHVLKFLREVCLDCIISHGGAIYCKAS